MLILNIDNFLYMTTFINFFDILNLSILSHFYYNLLDNEFYKYLFIKSFNNLFNEEFYKSLSIKYFSNIFIKSDKIKFLNDSSLIINYKKKLIHIEYLKKYANTLNLDRWYPNDFYYYWLYKNYLY